MFSKYLNCLTFLLLSIFFSNPAFAQASSNASETHLKVLSWNLYMRPRSVMHDGQVKRAYAIVDKLKNEEYDVIVFQEAFDKKARNIIWNGLKEKFPFNAGNPKRKSAYKLSTGVFIISKLPIKVIEDIYFSTCGGSDCLAVKGAVLISVTKNNHEIQIAGTHLQSADGRKACGEDIRQIQYLEIKNKLFTPHQIKGVPQLLIGDLNISKWDIYEYEKMISGLNMEDGQISGDNMFSAASENDLRSPNATSHLIDYVLCNKNETNITVVKRWISIFEQQWSKKHKALSDHYAVGAEVVFQ